MNTRLFSWRLSLIVLAGVLTGVLVLLLRFYDWQILMVKAGVTFLGEPSPSASFQATAVDHALEHPESVDYRIETVAEDFNLPWSLTFLPSANPASQWALVTERSGRLYRVSLDNGFRHAIEGLPPVFYKGQGGLFDIALHPDFAENQLIYLSYAAKLDDDKSSTRLAQARLVGEKLEAFQVLFTAQPILKSRKHFGGRLLVQDDFIYLTVGDRGQRHYAQQTDNHLGSVLRFHLDGSTPASNPFVRSKTSKAEVFSYGHRNPQGLAAHPQSRELWVSEHGPRGGDEINLLAAGANYGWPVITYGEEYRGGSIGEGIAKPGLQQPLHYYVPSIATGNLAIYAGDQFPAWQGDFFVTGLRSFSLSHLSSSANADNTQPASQNRRFDPQSFPDNTIVDQRMLEDLRLRLRDIKIDSDGNIFLLSENGILSKITPL